MYDKQNIFWIFVAFFSQLLKKKAVKKNCVFMFWQHNAQNDDILTIDWIEKDDTWF